MPWIDGRGPSHGLIPAGKMRDVIIEGAVGGERSGVEFVDGISHAISRVGGAVKVSHVLDDSVIQIRMYRTDIIHETNFSVTVPPLPSVTVPNGNVCHVPLVVPS